MKKKAALLLALMLPFSALAGCTQDAGQKTYPGTMDDASVWCVAATEKVLKNKSQEKYADVATDAIRVVAAKGEYESAQIIVSADETLAYEVKANNLTSGGNTFSASNVDIFHEKYINVTKPYGNVDAGKYPDALVPVENIKEAGENVVSAGENQGLYVRFHIPVDQEPGVYTGSVTLTIAGESKNVPVTLEVRDVTVSQTNHTQSVFLNEWLFYKGELNSTQEMFDAYNEALFEYRLNPNIILYDYDVESDEGIEAYVEKAYEYMKNNAYCSTISLPYATVRMDAKDIDTSALRIEDRDGMYVSDHDAYDFTRTAVDSVVNEWFGTYETLDASVMTRYLDAFAEKSFSEGYDMFSKLVTYFRLIDETHDQQGYSTVKMISLIFRNTANAASDKMTSEEGRAAIKAQYPDLDAKAKANGYESADAFIDAAAESVRNLYHVATIAAATDYEEIMPYLEGGCPLFDAYDTEAGRETYYDQIKKWWYGCVAPEPPYATYRIDDSMLSPRMVSWMQAQYGIVGNLYWSTCIYADNINWSYQEIDDYYEGDAERYPGANGDGFLFYPGAQYGIEGPVASMRLEAIRDGLEEYELLYAIQQKYNETGLQKDENGDGVNDYFTEMMEEISSDLYIGTVVTADANAFNMARERLFDLSALSESSASFCITGQTDDGKGNVEFTFAIAKDASVVLAEGSCGTLGQGVAVEGSDMKMYTVTVDLSQNATNTILLDITAADGTKLTYESYLGGRVQTNTVDETVTEADLAKTENGVDAVFEKVSASTATGAGWTERDVLKAALSARPNFLYQQAFTLGGTLIDGVNKDAASMKLSLFADSGRTVSVILVGTKGETSLASVTFSGTAQTLEISLSGVNWDKIGEVQCLRFNVASGDEALTVWIKDIVVYGK